MRQALCLLPDGPNYRRESFLAGVRAIGFRPVSTLFEPRPDDIVIMWNRHKVNEHHAARFERAGARVLVVENGYFGKRWLGHKWFALAWGHHSGAGVWPDGGPERWDSWGVEMQPWTQAKGPPLIFAQRGIGEPGVASPHRWAEQVQKRTGGRIRAHPGPHPPAVALADDLRDCGSAITWHSSAALQALILGVPVWYGYARWIGAGACKPLSEYGTEPARDDVQRLDTMRRVAWAMWTEEEILNGTALGVLNEIARDRKGHQR